MGNSSSHGCHGYSPGTAYFGRNLFAKTIPNHEALFLCVSFFYGFGNRIPKPLRCILFCLLRMCPDHQHQHAPLHTHARTIDDIHANTILRPVLNGGKKSKITHNPQANAGVDARGGTDLSKEKIPRPRAPCTSERNGNNRTKTTKTNTPAAERNVNLSHNFHARNFGPGHGLDFWPLGTAPTKPCPATFGWSTIAAMRKLSFQLDNSEIFLPNITEKSPINPNPKRRMHNSSFAAHALYSSTHCHTGLALATFSHRTNSER